MSKSKTVTIGNKTYYLTTEACEMAGISRGTLFRWIREGIDEDIEGIKVNVQVDYAHIAAIISPLLSVTSAMQHMRAQSAKKLRERFEFIR